MNNQIFFPKNKTSHKLNKTIIKTDFTSFKTNFSILLEY